MEQLKGQLAGFIASRPLLQELYTSISIFCHLLCLYLALKIAFNLAQGFRLYYLTGCCGRVNFVKKYGQWAIVTGSGDGIGRALLAELARRGMSVVVVDRDEEKLTATRQILEQIPECGQIETLKADLSDWSAENHEKIRAQISPERRDIGVLINCVATMPYKMLPFVEFHQKSMTTMVNLNVLAAVHLTRMVAPGMLTRGRGLIMNVASLAASLPAPKLNLYGPTKAFIEAFTYQLQMEFHSQPIDVVLLKPGPVVTSLADPTRNLKSSFVVLSPESYASSVIGALPAVPTMYTGTAIHGLTRILMETLHLLGLFRFVTDTLEKKHADFFKTNTKLKGPIDEQRINPVDDKARDSALLTNFSKEATSIDMDDETST